MSTIPSNIDSGSAEAIARDKIAERGFADTLRELETLKRTDRESREEWLKSWGFGLFAVLKHGPIGEVLSLLQDGWISRGKAAEAMAEIMLGNKPSLPEPRSSAFDDLDIPGEAMNTLRAEAARLREALEKVKHDISCPPEQHPTGGDESCPRCFIVDDIDNALSTDDGWLERRNAEIVVAISRDKTDAIAQIAALNVQLGTMIDRLAATEAERDGLSAVLASVQDVASERSTMSPFDELLRAIRWIYTHCEQSYGQLDAILDVRDARIRREAKAEALREARDKATKCGAYHLASLIEAMAEEADHAPSQPN